MTYRSIFFPLMDNTCDEKMFWTSWETGLLGSRQRPVLANFQQFRRTTQGHTLSFNPMRQVLITFINEDSIGTRELSNLTWAHR